MNIKPEALFNALSDTTRLRCLALLRAEGELCVCEITHALDLLQPRISRHLAQLRESGLLLDERRGQWVYYRMNPQLPAWTDAVIATSLEAVRDQEPYLTDRRRLETMVERPGRLCCA
ncbi:putative transcriptional regulator, ArsR family [Thioalkalivibrio sulfidiphilus HL-EbGr7]|uniref:Putative transcriptional regulator, ArsR family n=1 Tax=Thioalkalivibrio sulfidiphilus (strain HL-EbGR7) TaxID=396588 RepID=B8GSZ1_THISH|nr:metalloregulator ArsR/SmtB family transcription factor [Thioalkalivibrio sulfidiphilus]ACL73006.1 putative transcriptional regulator, ArsR family [Thioalkalivibrio sulfidiphilus HL-EbGr7]